MLVFSVGHLCFSLANDSTKATGSLSCWSLLRFLCSSFCLQCKYLITLARICAHFIEGINGQTWFKIDHRCMGITSKKILQSLAVSSCSDRISNTWSIAFNLVMIDGLRNLILLQDTLLFELFGCLSLRKRVAERVLSYSVWMTSTCELQALTSS